MRASKRTNLVRATLDAGLFQRLKPLIERRYQRGEPQMTKKAGIAGLGIIGSAVHKLFPDAKVYDPAIAGTWAKSDLNDCDIIFVCVPTPIKGEPPGSEGLDMSIVEDVVKQYTASSEDVEPHDILPLFVICSALQPGTADYLVENYFARIVVQPEYFGETQGHPLTDLSAQPFLILGGDSGDVDEVIELYQSVYNASVSIRKVSALEAEVTKLAENTQIFIKVLAAQLLYDGCIVGAVDYHVIRETVFHDDPRFNLWWTAVYPGKRGCQSKCIPKDVWGYRYWVKQNGGDTTVLDALLAYNAVLLGLGNE